MDVKIENRDIILDSCGAPIYISGIDEILQRVKISCSIKKGDFVYDTGLGRYDADFTNTELLRDKLEMVFKEATIDIPYTDLCVTNARKYVDKIKAVVKIICGNDSATTEVTIYG